MDKNLFKVENTGDNLDAEITKPFCCDLLSVAMGKAPAGSCWVTVMANMNTLAVAVLTEVACIVLAEGMKLDDTCLQKAVQQLSLIHIFLGVQKMKSSRKAAFSMSWKRKMFCRRKYRRL